MDPGLEGLILYFMWVYFVSFEDATIMAKWKFGRWKDHPLNQEQ